MIIYSYKLLFYCINLIVLITSFKSEDIFKNNFGYKERKRTIEKCANNLNLIFKENYLTQFTFDYDYDYVMNHCILIDRKFLKPNLKFLYDASKLKNGYNFNNLTKMSRLVSKSNLAKRLERERIPKENISALNNCLNIETLSKKYFYHKTIALIEHKEDEEKLYIFYKWLKENGAKFEKVDVYTDYETGMRGLYLLEDIKANENLILIPDKIVLTSDKAENSIVGRKMRNVLYKIIDYETVLITLFIIEEAHKTNSIWKPYLDVFPKDISNFPVSFSENEMELLKGFEIYERIIETKNRTMTYYNEYICPSAKNEFKVDYCQIISYETFVMYYHLVKSRVFAFNRNRLNIAGLSPLSDFLNHSYQENFVLWRYSYAYNGFLIYSMLDKNKRSEIFTSYGKAPNESILISWGFGLGYSNQHDSIRLKLQLSHEDKNYYLKFMLLNKNYIDSQISLELGIKLSSLKTMKFFNMFRFITYKDHLTQYLDLQFNLKNKGKTRHRQKEKNHNNALKVEYIFDNQKDREEYNFDPYGFTAVDINEEIYMINKLKSFLLIEYNKFHSSLEQDKNLYDTYKHEMSLNIRNIFEYRIGQKKILIFYINFCDEMLKLYEMEYYQFEKYIKDNKDELKLYEEYILNTAKVLMKIYKKDV